MLIHFRRNVANIARQGVVPLSLALVRLPRGHCIWFYAALVQGGCGQTEEGPVKCCQDGSWATYCMSGGWVGT